MKQERQKLEDVLSLILQDYSNDKKVIQKVSEDLLQKGISRGRTGGIFTQSIPLSYVSQTELCLITKYLYSHTLEYKIKPDEFFNELELTSSEQYQNLDKVEKTNRITLHNVDQLEDHLWLCSMETYQNISTYFTNGLLSYNPRTQRQPLKRKVGDRILEVINIDPKKISEIKDEMLKGTFNPNALIWNIRKVTGAERENFIYDAKNRTLTINVIEGIYVDIADGMHRMGAMIKACEEKPDINRITSIYIFFTDEEKILQVIRQQSKQTPISEEWLGLMDVTNPNTEVAKNINNRQRMNEMFNRVGLDNSELRRENKLVTFDTLSKTIEHIYNLKNKPFIEAQNVEKFLIDAFNIVIGINHSVFNENLERTRKTSYLADNNTFIGYIALAEELKNNYSNDWQSKFQKILGTLDFTKSEDSPWKKVGLENNLNLSTIKKVSEHFKGLAV